MNPVLKKILRIALKSLAWLFFLAQLILLYFGFASPLTTLAVYGFLTWLLLRLLGMFKTRMTADRFGNLRLLILSSLITLFVGEMALRFVFRTELSYHEANGSWFYVSPYRQVKLENLLRRHYLGEQDVSLRIRPSHSEHAYHKPEFSYVHHYNNEGLRDRDFNSDKPDSTFRIIALGDSFTEGVGAAPDSTWPRFLEKILAQEMPDQRIEVMSFGASGSDLVFERYKLEQLGLPYRPDLVILALNASDIDDLVVRGGGERFRDDQTLRYRAAPKMEYLYAFSYLYRLLRSTYSENNSFLLSPEAYELAKAESRNLILTELNAFQKLADVENFTFAVAFHPLLQEAEVDSLALREVYGQFAVRLPHVKIDLLAHWKEGSALTGKNLEDWYWRQDLHHTGPGYEAMAKAIAAALPKRLFFAGFYRELNTICDWLRGIRSPILT